MRSVLAMLAMSLLPVWASASILHVDWQGGGDFYTIQEAIVAAANGDVIVVHSGVYVENINYLGKDLSIQSEMGFGSTTIDGGGQGSCVTFRSGESVAAVLDGFTLTRGSGTLYSGVVVGGAMFCLQSSPTVTNCLFLENSSTYAAGIYVDDADVDLTDCTFRRNTAQTYGGGIAGPRSIPSIRRCVFEENYAGSGDGTIHLALSSIIEDCVFTSNRARAGAAINSGGYGADFQIRRCAFQGNYAHGTHGGAIRVHEASPLIEECLFVGNTSALDGGAIITLDGGATTITQCTFDRNSAGRYGGGIAIWSYAHPTISNCIIANAIDGGGVFCSDASATFHCNDAWENAGGNYWGDCGDPTGSNGNIALDPLFCDPELGVYGIRSDSPCAPENNTECGLIGAYGIACDEPTARQTLSWGALRSLYR